MRIYISAPVSSAQKVRDLVEALPIEWTFPSWPFSATLGYENNDLEAAAKQDLDEASCANLFVMFGDEGSKGGRFVELGIVLYKGIPILALGEKFSVFCHHPRIRWMSNINELIREIYCEGNRFHACSTK